MGSKGSILIIEHDENTCRSLRHILGMKGYETDLAGTGREAIDKAQGRFFDVALLDVRARGHGRSSNAKDYYHRLSFTEKHCRSVESGG